jgi:hypothetical protein
LGGFSHLFLLLVFLGTCCRNFEGLRTVVPSHLVSSFFRLTLQQSFRFFADVVKKIGFAHLTILFCGTSILL